MPTSWWPQAVRTGFSGDHRSSDVVIAFLAHLAMSEEFENGS